MLNAKHHAKESQIAQAGRLGAVTIATNMAGVVRIFCSATSSPWRVSAGIRARNQEVAGETFGG